MTDPEQSSGQLFPSAELIAAETGYELRGSYHKNVLDDRIARRSYIEHIDRVRMAIGEDNVVTSFYYNTDGELRWGVFARLPSEQQSAGTAHYPAKTDFSKGGSIATDDTVELRYPDAQPGTQEDAMWGLPPHRPKP